MGTKVMLWESTGHWRLEWGVEMKIRGWHLHYFCSPEAP